LSSLPTHGRQDSPSDRTDLTGSRHLKPREREALYLKGLGYSYNEIARLTGATYTAVNRRITEGRAALRRQVRNVQLPMRSTPTG
jgi:DNA invertase Pin-like site-specific DNA recombinase